MKLDSATCRRMRRARYVANCALATPRSAPRDWLRSYWAALEEATDPADAEHRLRMIIGDLERQYPSAAACLADDLPALCIHLRYLPRLRKRFRSTNLLERSLEEVRRRTKVIGRFPGES